MIVSGQLNLLITQQRMEQIKADGEMTALRPLNMPRISIALLCHKNCSSLRIFTFRQMLTSGFKRRK